mmetsp:Transcript_67352/g.125793  ORF Transcript_67352/g.125793 Transcript_67352/m.125793 type:complete len:162 (-) Transcript_67352:41-526(-)
MQASKPVLIHYHIPGDGDEADIPNVFPVMKAGGPVVLQDIRSKFPLPGTYHFRFKMKFGDVAAMWMDVTNEESQVPLFDGKIVAKVVRLSWDPTPVAQNGRHDGSFAAPSAPSRPSPPAQDASAASPLFAFDDAGSNADPFASGAPPKAAPQAQDPLDLFG